MTTTSYYAIVPRNATADEYAAGYDGNVFLSAGEAEAAIPALAEAFRHSGNGPDDGGAVEDWTVREFPLDDDARGRLRRLRHIAEAE